MTIREYGLYLGTRRGRNGKLRPVADAAMLIGHAELPAYGKCPTRYAIILTSRPMFPGARRCQWVPEGQFLNLSRLAEGSPAAKHTVADGVRETAL